MSVSDFLAGAHEFVDELFKQRDKVNGHLRADYTAAKDQYGSGYDGHDPSLSKRYPGHIDQTGWEDNGWNGIVPPGDGDYGTWREG